MQIKLDDEGDGMLPAKTVLQPTDKVVEHGGKPYQVLQAVYRDVDIKNAQGESVGVGTEILATNPAAKFFASNPMALNDSTVEQPLGDWRCPICRQWNLDEDAHCVCGQAQPK